MRKLICSFCPGEKVFRIQILSCKCTYSQFVLAVYVKYKIIETNSKHISVCLLFLPELCLLFLLISGGLSGCQGIQGCTKIPFFKLKKVWWLILFNNIVRPTKTNFRGISLNFQDSSGK